MGPIKVISHLTYIYNFKHILKSISNTNHLNRHLKKTVTLLTTIKQIKRMGLKWYLATDKMKFVWSKSRKTRAKHYNRLNLFTLQRMVFWTLHSIKICAIVSSWFPSHTSQIRERCPVSILKHDKTKHSKHMYTLFGAHYGDVITGTMAPQIVYWTVYSGADKKKHQSSAPLAFERGIHRGRWIPRTNGQHRLKCSIWWPHHVVHAGQALLSFFISVVWSTVSMHL